MEELILEQYYTLYQQNLYIIQNEKMHHENEENDEWRKTIIE